MSNEQSKASGSPIKTGDISNTKGIVVVGHHSSASISEGGSAGESATVNKAELAQQIAQLRTEIDKILQAGEIQNQGDVEDVNDAVEKANTEVGKDAPDGERVVRHLTVLTTILEKTSAMLQASGAVGAYVLGVVPYAQKILEFARAFFRI